MLTIANMVAVQNLRSCMVNLIVTICKGKDKR